MKRKVCPHCLSLDPNSDSRTHVVRVGFFKRKSDCRIIQRYRCKTCLKKFSSATGHPAFGQNKRQFNHKLMKLITSGVSLRRAARNLNLSRTTVDRKFRFLGEQAKVMLLETNLAHPPVKSDQNPHYPKDLKKAFPHATHETHKGQRGSIVGQGELKKIRFDPLFSLNHTCAMTRANMNRLFRRTWCTTKIPERLVDHFAIYAVYHNLSLI